MMSFYIVLGTWLVAWLYAGVFLIWQAVASRKVPIWIAVLWWVCGLVISRYVFGTALRRLRSVTSYTFQENAFVVENSFLTTRTRQIMERCDVRLVRQVYDGGQTDGLETHSWALLVEGPTTLKLLSHEEFETSAWLGHLIAQWAGVDYSSSENR